MLLAVFSEGNLNHIFGYYQKPPDTEEIVSCRDLAHRIAAIYLSDKMVIPAEPVTIKLDPRI